MTVFAMGLLAFCLIMSNLNVYSDSSLRLDKAEATHSAVVVTNTYGVLPQDWSLMNQSEPCDIELYH